MTFTIKHGEEEGGKEGNRCVRQPDFVFEGLDNIGEKIVGYESVER